MNTLTISVLTAALSLSLACRSRPVDSHSSTLETNGKEKNLEIIAEMEVLEIELSGMSFRSQKKGATGLYIVSDKSFKVMSIDFTDTFQKKHFYYDLRPLIPGTRKSDKSQWEAIATSKDHILILREYPSDIFVFSKNFKGLVQTITLNVPDSHAIFSDWDSQPNSRGEGMVLLKSGHILVVKEKKPVQLIEFGPKNAVASGYKRGDGVGVEDYFPLQAGEYVNFFPLKHWDVESQSRDLIPDVSDLAIGPDGNLYALSDQNTGIAAIQNVLSPTEDTFKVEFYWNLPKGIKKPEGLVINENFEPIVASDLPKIKRNLFHLKAIKRK